MKLKEIKSLIGADTISKKDNVYTIRKGFFYRMNKTAEDLKDRVIKSYSESEIIDYGEHYASFKGGQSVAQGSHWFVKFKLKELLR